MSNIQRIIGVDPGLTITGFGILAHKKDQIRLIAGLRLMKGAVDDRDIT